MLPETVTSAVAALVETYGSEHVRTAREGPRTFVRVAEVELYPTCRPPSAPMLIVFDPSQPKPQIYIQPGQLLANGKVPKNSSVAMVGGESWMQFSFNIPWQEEHGIKRFIAAARQRFSQHE